VDADRIALDTMFWVSRRAGLVLLFGRDRTVALLGKSGDLEELARAVERGSDRAAQRSLLQPLTREVVVCTAGTAVSGTIGGVRVSGLHLAVFTQQGLHLFAGAHRHSIRWPMECVREISPAPREHGRGALSLSSTDVSLTLRYLFPEEIHAVARVARAAPRPVEATASSLEMFARAEVAPPPEPNLPEFARSAETLTQACRDAAARVRIDPVLTPRFGETFFLRHFQDLGEVALGPLLMRKSAAAGAGSLARAVSALDAEQLRQDAVAAFRAASEHLFEVFRGAQETLLVEKRLDRQGQRRPEATIDDRSRIGSAVDQETASLDPVFARVLARQHLLLQRLHAREHAPPDTEDTGVEEAAGEWRTEIARLDREYGNAWRRLLDEVADVWSERFIPKLVALAAAPGRALSESGRLAILATVTFVVVAALAWWLF
jgi:hypothetical protein